MQLGTLTVKGIFHNYLDGLYMGSKKGTLRFKWTDQGFERKGKLHKTHDPSQLIKAIQVDNATYTLTTNIKD